MKGYSNQNSTLKLKIRDSLKGQELFGQIQSGEYEIEGKLTKKLNQWNLGSEYCYYFEFRSTNMIAQAFSGKDFTMFLVLAIAG